MANARTSDAKHLWTASRDSLRRCSGRSHGEHVIQRLARRNIAVRTGRMSQEKHGPWQAPTGCRTVFDSCYAGCMSDEPQTLDRVLPSATPSEEDMRAWEALPREEQLRLLRAALIHPDCSTVSAATMSEILAEAVFLPMALYLHQVARSRAEARSRG